MSPIRVQRPSGDRRPAGPTAAGSAARPSRRPARRRSNSSRARASETSPSPIDPADHRPGHQLAWRPPGRPSRHASSRAERSVQRLRQHVGDQGGDVRGVNSGISLLRSARCASPSMLSSTDGPSTGVHRSPGEPGPSLRNARRPSARPRQGGVVDHHSQPRHPDHRAEAGQQPHERVGEGVRGQVEAASRGSPDVDHFRAVAVVGVPGQGARQAVGPQPADRAEDHHVAARAVRGGERADPVDQGAVLVDLLDRGAGKPPARSYSAAVMARLQPGIITYGPRYSGSGCPDGSGRTPRPGPPPAGSSRRSQNFSGNSSVRGRSRPPTISSPSPNARRMLRTQSGRGRQSASVLARWVAPCAMAWRMPVSAAAPVPFLGLGDHLDAVPPGRSRRCRRCCALSTTTSVKSWSSCSASALQRRLDARAASL